MRHVLAVGFGLALWLGLTASAPAAFVLSISNPGPLNSGQSALLNVSIAWNGTGTNLLAPGSEGLNAATVGLRLAPTSLGTVTAVATPVLGTDVIPNPGLNASGPTGNQAFGSAGMPASPSGSNLLGAFLSAPGTGAIFASNALANTPVLIGSFRVTGGSPGGVTVVAERLDPNPVSIGQFVSGAGNPLDDPLLLPPGTGGVAPGSIQFQVVPEPTSMALVGMAAAGFVGNLWRKRRQAKAAAPEAAV